VTAQPTPEALAVASLAELRVLILEGIARPDPTPYGAAIRNKGRDALVVLLARAAEADEYDEAQDRVRKEYLAAARKATERAESAEADCDRFAAALRHIITMPDEDAKQIARAALRADGDSE